MLSEEEQKAGKVAAAPEQSGEWTVAALTPDLKVEMERLVDAARAEEEARRAAPPAGSPDGPTAAEGAADAAPATWRRLRHEIWRQTGALVDLEKLFAGPRDELVASLTEQVARSLIQQRERLFDLCDEVIGILVGQFCPARVSSDDWDFDGLEEAVRDQFAVELSLRRKVEGAAEVAAQIWGEVETRLADREKDLSRPWLMYFARHFYLEDIDQQWIEHLKTMEHLREGIGLRGYGQKDPKKEYKREGFDLFAQMMQSVQLNASKKIFRVQIQRQEAPLPDAQRQRRTIEQHQTSSTSGADPVGRSGEQSRVFGKAADGGATAEKPQTVRRDQPKVGRNDPCPCGSGKKYKKCHGREESVEA
jgi:preprotein translocase subunit SecA